MKASSSDRQKKVKFAFSVLAVGLIVSGLVAVMLLFISRMHPHF